MRALVILTLTLLALPVALAEEGAPPPDPAEPLANRQIYVPIKDLDVLLAARGGEGVLMSLEEYASLRAAARRSPPDPRAPLSAALRRAVVRGAESAGAAGEGGLALSVTLDVEIFTDDWVRMPLRLPTAAFSKVSVPEGVEVFLQAPAGKSRQLVGGPHVVGGRSSAASRRKFLDPWARCARPQPPLNDQRVVMGLLAASVTGKSIIAYCES